MDEKTTIKSSLSRGICQIMKRCFFMDKMKNCLQNAYNFGLELKSKRNK